MNFSIDSLNEERNSAYTLVDAYYFYWGIPLKGQHQKWLKFDGFRQVVIPIVYTTVRRHRSESHKSPRWPSGPGCMTHS